MKLIMENWNKFLKEQATTSGAPFYTTQAQNRQRSGENEEPEDEEPEEEETEENIPGGDYDPRDDLDTIDVDDYDADTFDDEPVTANDLDVGRYTSKDARDSNLDPVAAASDGSEFVGGSHGDPRKRDQSMNLPDTSKDIAWGGPGANVGPTMDDSEYFDLAAKNYDKQERNLRKAGFRSMERLQAMVGAKKTGDYDAQTVAKIMAFQKGLGLKGKDVDGIYGAGTRRAFKRKYGDKKNKGLAMAKKMSNDSSGIGFSKTATDRKMRRAAKKNKKNERG